MATALISGLKQESDPGLRLRVADPSEEARIRLQSDFDLEVRKKAADIIRGADVIVLAIKPQVIPAVLAELGEQLEPQQLVLSIAAGISITAMANQLSPQQAIIRAMPNTPALVGEGITVLVAGEHCRPHHREQAERILRSAGVVIWLEDETLMDAVTAVSGSGPAYFFLLTETLAAAGERLGLPSEIAHRLAERTCSGAGAMLKDSAAGVEELRRRVTSPGGTTQAALQAFEQGDFAELVFKAVSAAQQRGIELSRIPGQE